MLSSIAAIGLGAACGGVLRWLLGISLNAFFPFIPLGTLVANLSGGYLIGLAIGVFSESPHLAPEWRLLVITGFLGGLTTFSTFSAEVVDLCRGGRFFMAGCEVFLHVAGSLLLTFLGMATFYIIKRLGA